MEKKEENQRREDRFVRRYFIISAGILILFVALGVVEIDVVIERAIRILSFWFLLFVSVFVPRRILKKSKKFRYIVLYIRKHYPMVYYYRDNIQIIWHLNFFFWYTAFYLERILKYILVGTKIKWLSPYRKNWERGKFWMLIIIEGYRWIHYAAIYVLKIFYEIIKFFDNATIYKIIRSRILGFMMVTIGYIIIGVNFFICYVISILIIGMIYNILNIYVTYKEWMKKYPSAGRLSNLEWVLIARGYINRLEIFSKLEILQLRRETMLIFNVLKQKSLAIYYSGINRKYGLKRVTKCWLNINGLTEVEEKTLLAVYFFKLKEEEEEKIKIIKISKYKFTERFWKKKEWYNADSIMDPLNAKIEDNYSNTLEFYQKSFCNFLDFKLYFMFWVMCCGCGIQGIWNEKDEMVVDFWKKSTRLNEYYLGVLKEYFEFRDIYKFVKELDKKIYEKEKDFIKFYNKNVVEEELFLFIKNCFIHYKLEKIITDQEYQILKCIGSLLFMSILELEINKKELKEIIEKKKYIEVLKGLKEKGYLKEELIKYLEYFDIYV